MTIHPLADTITVEPAHYALLQEKPGNRCRWRMNRLDNRVIKDGKGATANILNINQPAGFNQLGGRPNTTLIDESTKRMNVNVSSSAA